MPSLSLPSLEEFCFELIVEDYVGVESVISFHDHLSAGSLQMITLIWCLKRKHKFDDRLDARSPLGESKDGSSASLDAANTGVCDGNIREVPLAKPGTLEHSHLKNHWKITAPDSSNCEPLVLLTESTTNLLKKRSFSSSENLLDFLLPKLGALLGDMSQTSLCWDLVKLLEWITRSGADHRGRFFGWVKEKTHAHIIHDTADVMEKHS
ncbi:hypothetical protein CDAR_243791 [Caerostris darwini]|uniref:Uncharacterized protein n=1 Tax=Caerostris darwini TaxID=1538125 RepID=A0AAV4N3N6_9ARAC|nr:hypothetical protein CDAR_243791 [Caerostris darwini]